MTAKKFITDNLKQIVVSLGAKDIDPVVLPSENSSNGDYYTNVAMRLASTLKKKPIEIAYEIRDEFKKSTTGLRSIKGVNDNLIERVEAVEPGFVNFFLSEASLAETVKTVSAHENFGDSNSLKDQKVMVEFTDPNPFKEFHIGHLYSNIVGESLARLFESQGATLARACYQGDVGLHVAKAIYGMQNLISDMPDDAADLAIRAQFMGKAYAYGATRFEADESVKKAIQELNKKIYEAKDEDINSLYEKGRAWSLEYFDTIYARLGTKFDYFFFESEMAPLGIKLVNEFLGKTFVESDGAVIYEGKNHGLHNRVFINSLGLPTYEAKDLALVSRKYEEFKYDKSVIITAEEQSNYFKVVLSALKQIHPDLASKTQHIAHGMVRLPSGKMSSRTGDVITGTWLLDEVIARIQKEYSDMSDEIAEKVGVAAVKFAFLKVGVGRDLEFNIEESIALSGASGPYLQYSYVRTKSLLAKSQGPKADGEAKSFNKEEKELARQLMFFPEVVEQASDKLSPNLVAEYLLVLAQKFNLFYQKHQVVGDTQRIELTKAVGNVLSHGLTLLGIETVERM